MLVGVGLLSERSEDDDEQGEIVIAGLDTGPLGDHDELDYELDEWSDRDRAVLRERLEVLAVPHRWEDTTLIVAATDEAWVERVMDQVEDDLADALDDDVEQIAYDLSGWEEASVTELVERLTGEAVPFDLVDQELLVHEIDEQRVDEIVEAIVNPDAAPPTGSGGGDVMGGLFVAADRLVHDPRDHDGTLALIEAIRQAATTPAPYGMDKVWWDGVQAQAAELVELMDGPSPDDGAVIDRAVTLRDGLRPYV